MLPRIYQAWLAFQFALQQLHLRRQHLQRSLLRVQNVVELLQQFLLLHVSKLQLDEARLVHAGKGYLILLSRARPAFRGSPP